MKWERELRTLQERVETFEKTAGMVNALEADVKLLKIKVELGSTIPGASNRKGCDQVRGGACHYWSFSIPPTATLIQKAFVKNGDLWNPKVSEYPEICATCAYNKPIALKLPSGKPPSFKSFP